MVLDVETAKFNYTPLQERAITPLCRYDQDNGTPAGTSHKIPGSKKRRTFKFGLEDPNIGKDKIRINTSLLMIYSRSQDEPFIIPTPMTTSIPLIDIFIDLICQFKRRHKINQPFLVFQRKTPISRVCDFT